MEYSFLYDSCSSRRFRAITSVRYSNFNLQCQMQFVAINTSLLWRALVFYMGILQHCFTHSCSVRLFRNGRRLRGIPRRSTTMPPSAGVCLAKRWPGSPLPLWDESPEQFCEVDGQEGFQQWSCYVEVPPCSLSFSLYFFFIRLLIRTCPHRPHRPNRILLTTNWIFL